MIFAFLGVRASATRSPIAYFDCEPLLMNLTFLAFETSSVQLVIGIL